MKHKIKEVYINFENLKVKIKNKWYYMKVDKLIGLNVGGNLIKKRTREWLE